jgi:hypothetical protein
MPKQTTLAGRTAVKTRDEAQVRTGLLREMSAFFTACTRIALMVEEDMKSAKAKEQGDR